MKNKFHFPKISLLYKLLLTLLIITILNFIITPPKPKSPAVIENISEIQVPNTTGAPQGGTPRPQVPSRIYYLRSTAVTNPVSALFWSSSEPLYLTDNKIKDFSQNTTVYTFPPSVVPLFIAYSSNINVVSGNKIISYNPESGKTTNYEYTKSSFYSPKLDQKGVLSDKGLVLTLADNTTVNVPKTEVAVGISWSKDENTIAAYSASLILIYSVNTKKTSQIMINSSPKQVEFSPSGRYLAVRDPQKITIYDITNPNFTSIVKLDKETTAFMFSWTTSDKLFIFEKRSKPLEVDYVYLYDFTYQVKLQVTDSYGIPSRINFNIPPVSESENALIFSNNNLHPWAATTQPAHPSQLDTPLSHDD